jgi:hypothetical protein
MLTKTSLLRSYKLPVFANYGAAQTAWRTIAPTPHTATVPRDKTDNKHLRQSKNALEPYNKSTRPKTNDVSAFFCHFLGDHGVKPAKVLKKAGLEGSNWEDPDSVPAIYKATTKFWPRTVRSDCDADASSAADDSDAGADASDQVTEFLLPLWGAYRVCSFSFVSSGFIRGGPVTHKLSSLPGLAS